METITNATIGPVALLIIMLVCFVLGWAACLWRNRNRSKADQIEAMIRDAGKEANEELRTALQKAKGIVLRE